MVRDANDYPQAPVGDRLTVRGCRYRAVMGETQQESVVSAPAWTAAENELLAERLRQGVSIGEIARRMGRTAGAIRAQAVKMAPADLGLGAGEVIGWLRVQLAHGHDWRATLEERLMRPSRNGERWSDPEVERLVDELRGEQAWQQIANDHERTKGAIIAQASRMLLLTEKTVDWSRSRRAEQLRLELRRHEDYDWRRALQVDQATGRTPSWVFVVVGASPDGAWHVRVGATDVAAERIRAEAEVPEGTAWETFERPVLPDYSVSGVDEEENEATSAGF